MFEKSKLFICIYLLFYLFRAICIFFYHPKNRTAYSDKSGCSIASGGSSIGASSTATLGGNEFHSLTVSDDFPTDNLHIEFSTTYGKCLFHFSFANKTKMIARNNRAELPKKKMIE